MIKIMISQFIKIHFHLQFQFIHFDRIDHIIN
jgi:hypothetical protein